MVCVSETPSGKYVNSEDIRLIVITSDIVLVVYRYALGMILRHMILPNEHNNWISKLK